MAKGNKNQIIETPRGRIIRVKWQGGRTTCRLLWKKGFAPERTRQMQTVQACVDMAVLRYCQPYIPMRTGMLMRSGDLGTEAGAGVVRYIAPYAHRLYYGKDFNFDRTAHPNAGPLWFDRMLVDHKGDILREAAATAGGKAHE